MPTLSEHTNVENTALVILQEKGYQTWQDGKTGHLWAEKQGWDFLADSAVALLGLVAIYEHTSPATCTDYWWRRREPWLRDKLPSAPEPFESVMRKG